MRLHEPGWIRIGALCSAGRRSLWVRQGPDEAIELCAGREGNDSYVRIDKGNPIFQDLLNVLLDAQFAAET